MPEQVGRLRAGGHRTLIYSQFTMLLDLLEDWLLARRWPFFRLDGNVGVQGSLAVAAPDDCLVHV